MCHDKRLLNDPPRAFFPRLFRSTKVLPHLFHRLFIKEMLVARRYVRLDDVGNYLAKKFPNLNPFFVIMMHNFCFDKIINFFLLSDTTL